MASRRVPWTLRGVLIALTLYATDFLLFGRMRNRYFNHTNEPGEWLGLLGREKRIFLYVPLLLIAIVWAVRSQRARSDSASAHLDGADASPVDAEAQLEAAARRSANAERRRAVPSAARQAARAEVARFPLVGLSIGEKLDREKTNGQVYLLIGVFSLVCYLLGASLFGLKGVAALAATAPGLALLAWRVKRTFEPIEVAVGVDAVTLHVPGTRRVLPIARIESAESAKNALGDAVLVVVRHTTGRTDDLLVGLLDGDRDRDRTLIERADAIAARIEALLAENVDVPESS